MMSVSLRECGTAPPPAPARPASAPVNYRLPAASTAVRRPGSLGLDVAEGGRVELDVSYSRDEVDVCREMVLVSLVEGTVRPSGIRAVLYKCHMCSGFVTSLGGLTRHMATHGSAPTSSTTPDDVQRSRHKAGVLTARRSWSPGAWLTPVDRCNGHADGAEVMDSDVTADEVATVSPPSAGVVHDSSQPRAEDLSRTGVAAAARRPRPAAGGRRRPAAGSEPTQCRRQSQRLAFVSSEMIASDQLVSGQHGSRSGELASEIRAKEHLDDDVTVVIPSDAPLDYAARTETQQRSDTPAWSQCSEDGKYMEEIAHAPVKSIMGLPHVHRKARLSGSSASTAVSAGDVGSNSHAVSSSSSKSDTSLTCAQQMPLLNVSAESLQLSSGLPAMFGPLALSTFVHGFGGLVAAASPFLSYYTQMPTAASLASLMAVTNTPLVSPPATNSAIDCTKSSELQESKSEDVPADNAGMQVEEGSSNESEGSGWTSDQLSTGLSSPVAKCSSLSRTHSRLNVVRRPIKREDACRPVVLADGRTAFRCFYCKKDFCTISDVNRHMDFHEDIRPYKCRFCNYYARTNSQLKVHMMRHQGIREYMCRLCNYKGVTQSDLNRHTKSQIHLMKARNECIQCSEGFVSPMNLEQHRQDKHSALKSSVSQVPVLTSNAEREVF